MTFSKGKEAVLIFNYMKVLKQRNFYLERLYS